MKKAFLLLSFCMLALVSCGMKQSQPADSKAALAEIKTDDKDDHVLTLLRLFNKQKKTVVGTEGLRVLEAQWGKGHPDEFVQGWTRYDDDEWSVESYKDPDTKAETLKINMLGEDTEGAASMTLQALPKKDGAWWCLVGYQPSEDYPTYYCYELRNGKLTPAKSPLDTYKKTHDSMDPWVFFDETGTGIVIQESFVATYTLRVEQRFSWDGEKFTLSEITPNNGLENENKVCAQAWENEPFQFDKFAVVPAGGTLGLLLSDEAEEAQALFNLGPYETNDPDAVVQMLQGCHRSFGLFNIKFFEHGTVAEQSCGSGCSVITYTLMEHWSIKHQLRFTVVFDDYDEATDTYNVVGDVSYELDGQGYDETAGEALRHRIVEELGHPIEVNPKWLKIGNQ